MSPFSAQNLEEHVPKPKYMAKLRINRPSGCYVNNEGERDRGGEQKREKNVAAFGRPLPDHVLRLHVAIVSPPQGGWMRILKIAETKWVGTPRVGGHPQNLQ